MVNNRSIEAHPAARDRWQAKVRPIGVNAVTCFTVLEGRP